jgi:hypothetical protein
LFLGVPQKVVQKILGRVLPSVHVLSILHASETLHQLFQGIPFRAPSVCRFLARFQLHRVLFREGFAQRFQKGVHDLRRLPSVMVQLAREPAAEQGVQKGPGLLQKFIVMRVVARHGDDKGLCK